MQAEAKLYFRILYFNILEPNKMRPLDLIYFQIILNELDICVYFRKRNTFTAKNHIAAEF